MLCYVCITILVHNAIIHKNVPSIRKPHFLHLSLSRYRSPALSLSPFRSVYQWHDEVLRRCRKRIGVHHVSTLLYFCVLCVLLLSSNISRLSPSLNRGVRIQKERTALSLSLSLSPSLSYSRARLRTNFHTLQIK